MNYAGRPGIVPGCFFFSLHYNIGGMWLSMACNALPCNLSTTCNHSSAPQHLLPFIACQIPVLQQNALRPSGTFFNGGLNLRRTASLWRICCSISAAASAIRATAPDSLSGSPELCTLSGRIAWVICTACSRSRCSCAVSRRCSAPGHGTGISTPLVSCRLLPFPAHLDFQP